MKKRILVHISAILLLFLSLSAGAAYYEDHQTYANATLQGLKTVSVNIDTPIGSDYGEMLRYGVTKNELQEKISQRLRDAGFDVISFKDALEDPDAVLLDLRVRVVIPWGSYYAYDLNLSVKQKVPLPRDSNAFYSVRTWSDGQIGALQISGVGLHYLYDYSMQLVENFIKAHQAQN